MVALAKEENKNVVQRWIDEVFNDRQIDSVERLKVLNYLDWTPLPAPYQHVERPVSGIKDALPEWLAALPDFHFVSDHLFADGDFVVCLGHWNAHHRAAYKGHGPTDKAVGGTRIDIFRIAGDKMVEHWGCGNELAFLQLVGALPSNSVEGAEAPASTEQVAARFVEEVLNHRNLAVVAELVAPLAIDHSRLALSLLELVTAFPDVQFTVSDIRSDGEDIFVTSSVSGTHEGPYMGIPPTGKRATWTRVDRLRVAEGKVVEMWQDSDDAVLASQLVS
jgi:predicted ester cyclase